MSDGVETRAGDPVAAARQLHEQDIAVVIDVVGFDVQDQAEAQQLRQIAEVTGGAYFDARIAQDLDTYFDQQLKARSELLEHLVCQVSQLTTFGTCFANLQREATLKMSHYRSEFTRTGATEQADAIGEMIDGVYKNYEQRYAEFQGWQGRISELNQQLQELDQRIQERSAP